MHNALLTGGVSWRVLLRLFGGSSKLCDNLQLTQSFEHPPFSFNHFLNLHCLFKMIKFIF